MNGQKALVRGTDSNLYWLWLRTSPADRSYLNEAVGSQLLLLIGLPTTRCSYLYVPEKTLREHPNLMLDKPRRSARQDKILCLGSHALLSGKERKVYEHIPLSWLPRVVNRGHLLGILLFDLWANSCQPRRPIFVSNSDSSCLTAVFANNDCLFGGRFGQHKTTAAWAMLEDFRFYACLWHPQTVAKWINRISHIEDSTIDNILYSIPMEWADSQAKCEVYDQLLNRRVQLRKLIGESRKVMGSTRLAELADEKMP